MRTTVLAALAAVTLAALPAAPAHAAPSAEGLTCGYAFLANPAGPEGTQLAELDGGPIVVADGSDLTANPMSVTLTCTLQVGWVNRAHAGADAASASASGTTVVTLPPTVVAFRLEPEWETVFVCTELTINDFHGVTHHLYWDHEAEVFSTSDAVICAYPDLGPEPGPEPWPDPLVCPVFVGLPPGVPGVIEVRADGDVYVAGTFLWDCPPYEI